MTVTKDTRAIVEMAVRAMQYAQDGLTPAEAAAKACNEHAAAIEREREQEHAAQVAAVQERRAKAREAEKAKTRAHLRELHGDGRRAGIVAG